MESENMSDYLVQILNNQAYFKNIIQIQRAQIAQLLKKQQITDTILSRIQKNMCQTNNLQPNNSQQSNIRKMDNFHDQYGYPSHGHKVYTEFKEDVRKMNHNDELLSKKNSSKITRQNSLSSMRSSRRKIHSIPKNLLNSKIFLRPNLNQINQNKFQFDQNKIKAKSNGWYQITMNKVISLKQSSFFEIRLLKSQQDNIIVGIASNERIQCPSSIGSGKQIAMNLWNMHIFIKGSTIKNYKVDLGNTPTIKVVIEDQSIKWIHKQKVLGSATIPLQLRLCSLSPYIQLYNKNDVIQLL